LYVGDRAVWAKSARVSTFCGLHIDGSMVRGETVTAQLFGRKHFCPIFSIMAKCRQKLLFKQIMQFSRNVAGLTFE
jgi:hypothetical protein